MDYPKCPLVRDEQDRRDIIASRMKNGDYACNLVEHFRSADSTGLTEAKAFYMDADMLLYNTQNGRLNALRIDLEGNLVGDDTQDGQDECHKLLEEQCDELYAAIKNDGVIKKAIVITPDGRVLEGNRRLFVYRALAASSKSLVNMRKGIPVVVFESDDENQQKSVEDYYSLLQDPKKEWSKESKCLACYKMMKKFGSFENYQRALKTEHHQQLSKKDFDHFAEVGRWIFEYVKHRRDKGEDFDAEGQKFYHAFIAINAHMQEACKGTHDPAHEKILQNFYFALMDDHLADKSKVGGDIYKYILNRLAETADDFVKLVKKSKEVLGVPETEVVDVTVGADIPVCEEKEPPVEIKPFSKEQLRTVLEYSKELRCKTDITTKKTTHQNKADKAFKAAKELKDTFEGTSACENKEKTAETIRLAVHHLQFCLRLLGETEV